MYGAIKRYMRLSLSAWLSVVAISCVLAFAYARFIRPSHLEANAIRALKDLGIDVDFNYEHDLSGKADPPGPTWIKAVFGEMALARIETVNLSGGFKTLDNCGVHLSQLTYLRNLSIDSDVLENIEAINQLKQLKGITLYCESKSLEDIEVLSSMNLSRVSIWACNGLKSIDPLGKIVTLEELNLHYCDGIRKLSFCGWETKKLKEVYIANCNELFTLSFGGLSQGSEPCKLGLCDCLAVEKVAIESDSNLDSISVHNCTKLDSLDVLPESLNELYLSDCDSLRKIGTTKLPKLTCVDIGFCNRLVSLDAMLKTAEIIRLSECDGIQCLDLTQPIPKLQCVRIGSCNGLTLINGLPKSVEILDIEECQSLVRVTAEAGLPNLRVCEIVECPILLESPNETQTKQRYRGPNKTKVPQNKGTGDR